jgi:hypothetical protein
VDFHIAGPANEKLPFCGTAKALCINRLARQVTVVDSNSEYPVAAVHMASKEKAKAFPRNAP